MPEPVPRRLLDSASLRLYQATQMAQAYGYGYGYGYGYYGPPPARGNYGAQPIELPDLTGPSGSGASGSGPSTAQPTEVVDPSTDPFGPSTGAIDVSSAAEASAPSSSVTNKNTDTSSTDNLVNTATTKRNGAGASVASALAAIMAGLVYALAF
jgi:hypothetical protein